jgi:hypothetical protein
MYVNLYVKDSCPQTYINFRATVRLEESGKLIKKSNDFIGNRTRDLQCCRIVPLIIMQVSYDVGFNPSTQRHYRRLIYYLYIHIYTHIYEYYINLR